MSVSIKKVSLEHSHACLLTHCLRLLLSYNATGRYNCKAKKVYHLTLYRKSGPIPVLIPTNFRKTAPNKVKAH